MHPNSDDLVKLFTQEGTVGSPVASVAPLTYLDDRLLLNQVRFTTHPKNLAAGCFTQGEGGIP
ncbi:MAG: hypothetical protein EP304_04985 [Deltaproteobacteria bacterium]|nr:MAG: hypothetical protein EP304_04985 [Deltaproteobacteria bacterium]